jgi:hypothetical protein
VQVVKTRLQLQGELQQRVAKNKRTYRGVWHAFKTIISTEGPLAIQKGTGTRCRHRAMRSIVGLAKRLAG